MDIKDDIFDEIDNSILIFNQLGNSQKDINEYSNTNI